MGCLLLFKGAQMLGLKKGVILVLLFGFASTVTAGSLTCGHVLDAVTGAPIENAVVTSGGQLVHTDTRGHFVIADSGDEMKIRAPGYQLKAVQGPRGHDIGLQPFSAKALYLSYYGIAEPSLRKPALELIRNTELNALVIDVKGDRGNVAFKVETPLAKQIGAQSIITVKNPKELIGSLKQQGVYTIARIVVFKDNLLAKARPDLAIRTSTGNLWVDGEGLSWVDPFYPEVWEYNIALAEEAAKMGFDEVQFDYIRFPDRLGLQFAKENKEENRVRAITDFLGTARKRLDPYNVFLSADIFGYVCWNQNDTAIGQRLEDLARHLDYISPMLYPSGFSHGVGSYRNPVKNPYEVISLTLNRAQQRTGLSSARFRPWLQAFRDYAFDRRHFGDEEIRAQTSASEEFGSNGWMLWNARNVYSNAGLTQKSLEARAEGPEALASSHPEL